MERAERLRWLTLLERTGRFLVSLPAPFAWLLVLAWMVLIWALSERSFGSKDHQGAFAWAMLGNLAHAPLFGFLTLLVAGATSPRSSAGTSPLPTVSRMRASLVFLFVLAWGICDEWHQSSTPGRDASALDIVTDAVGALIVIATIGYMTRGLAQERGVRLRLLLGVAVCIATAASVTALG